VGSLTNYAAPANRPQPTCRLHPNALVYVRIRATGSDGGQFPARHLIFTSYSRRSESRNQFFTSF